jgi:RND family efflux transporter MFP subunit
MMIKNSAFKMNKKKIFFSLILLLGFSLLGPACSNKSEVSSENSDKLLIPAVEAVRAQYGALPLTERLTGVVKAKNQIDIYAEISAPIIEVNVEDGDFVENGEVLVRLRDDEFDERLKQAKAAYQITVAQIKQAAARLKEAQTELERAQSLAEKGLSSPAELVTIQTRAVSAEADVELAKARADQAQAVMEERQQALSQTIIKAPVSGRVGNRNAEIGMLVDDNARLFTLGKLDKLRIEVILTDRMLNYIETGQRVDIFSENFPSGFKAATLSRISPFLHPVTHSTDAEIDLENPEGVLKSGMFVTVDVYYGESEQATLIPLSALYENPLTGATGVYITRDSLNWETVVTGNIDSDEPISLTEPVSFEFVPVDVIAKGRMKAGISGIEPRIWTVTLGQDLFGGESGKARVRSVKWDWVELLQNLQRNDLLKEIMNRQQASVKDSVTG